MSVVVPVVALCESEEAVAQEVEALAWVDVRFGGVEQGAEPVPPFEQPALAGNGECVTVAPEVVEDRSGARPAGTGYGEE